MLRREGSDATGFLCFLQLQAEKRRESSEKLENKKGMLAELCSTSFIPKSTSFSCSFSFSPLLSPEFSSSGGCLIHMRFNSRNRFFSSSISPATVATV